MNFHDVRLLTQIAPRDLRAGALILSLAVTLVPGCGKAGPKGPHGTVHGKVMVKGAPVPSGTVVNFLNEVGTGASAVAGADGSYKLVSQHGDKVPVGSYKVSIMPAQQQPSLTPEQQMEASMKAQQSGTSAAPDDSPIPEKYRNPMTTTETRDVKEGDNEINIDLTE